MSLVKVCMCNNVCMYHHDDIIWLPPIEGLVDYEPLRQELSLSADLNRQCFNITIIDEAVPEQDEAFWISLSWIRDTAGRYLRSPYWHRATIVILDDDGKSVIMSVDQWHNMTQISTVNCTSGCVNGICRYPGVCQCFEGWIEEDCSRG